METVPHNHAQKKICICSIWVAGWCTGFRARVWLWHFIIVSGQKISPTVVSSTKTWLFRLTISTGHSAAVNSKHSMQFAAVMKFLWFKIYCCIFYEYEITYSKTLKQLNTAMNGSSSQRFNYRYMIIPYLVFYKVSVFCPISNEISVTELRQLFRFCSQVQEICNIKTWHSNGYKENHWPGVWMKINMPSRK